VKAFLQAPVLLVIKHQEPETSGDQTVTKSLFCFFKNTKCNRIIAASDMKKTEPVLVAFREAAEPDDVPVVEADQQMHLQVQVILPLSALARVRPSDRCDEAVDEAGPVYCWDRSSALAGIDHRLFYRSTVGSFADQPSTLSPITESTIERTNTRLVGPAGT
jgi:hypothetical protein